MYQVYPTVGLRMVVVVVIMTTDYVLTMMKKEGVESMTDRAHITGMIFLILPRVQIYRDLIG